VGPCLELLDWALDALEGEGLMVLLDLHGCVGGESGGAPCGHRHDGWQPGSWDRKASLRVLEKVAKRYAGRVGICGIAVCNEPSEKVPARELAEYYKNAIQIIRQAGMRAGEVVVVLPVFTESRKDELLEQWSQNYLEFEDCIFDLHLYQCFGMGWNLLPESQHLNRAKARRHLLQSLPACTVGEWSLQLPGKVVDGLDEDQKKVLLERFAGAQLDAYEWATHGWFFWSWKDSAGVQWSMRDCLEDGLVQVPEGGRSGTVVTP